MIIMGCRYAYLQYVMAAYNKINVPLVGFDGTELVPFFNFDDIGIYLLIPKLVHFFKLSLDQGINLFFYTQIAVAFALGIIGFLLLCRSNIAMIFSIVSYGLFLRLIFYQLYDVYIAYLASFLSIIPLFLYFMLKNDDYKFFNYFLLFAGLLIGYFHYLRSHSALPVLGFIVCMILLHKDFALIKKIGLLAYLLFGIMLSGLYFNSCIHHYQKFAREQFKGFDSLQTKHVFWHPVYLGFGLLKIFNKDNITYDDAFADKKVREIDPTVSIIQTQQYETILKHEVLKLFKNQRGFVIATIFAKIGILLSFLIFFANFGLLAFFYCARRNDLELAFFCAFVLSSITPILTLPYYQYSLSFISCSFVFGLFYIQQFLEQLNFRTIVLNIKPLMRLRFIFGR